MKKYLLYTNNASQKEASSYLMYMFGLKTNIIPAWATDDT